MIKFVEDMLQKEGVITNDNKDNCKGVKLTPVESMPKFSYRIIINSVL